MYGLGDFREISLLDVQEDALYRPFNTLSNGEQTKVLLAALFLTASCFCLLMNLQTILTSMHVM